MTAPREVWVSIGIEGDPRVTSSLEPNAVRYVRADTIHPGSGHIMIRHDDGCSIAGLHTLQGFLICCECGAPAYGNGHVVRKTHEVLEEVAANLDMASTICEKQASVAGADGYLAEQMALIARQRAFERSAAIVRAATAYPPAPARDLWVPVADAPEEWRDGRELLMWNGRDWWIGWWRYNGPGNQGYPISATHMMLIPDPPKGD